MPKHLKQMPLEPCNGGNIRFFCTYQAMEAQAWRTLVTKFKTELATHQLIDRESHGAQQAGAAACPSQGLPRTSIKFGAVATLVDKRVKFLSRELW